jgi:hypothetical protein
LCATTTTPSAQSLEPVKLLLLLLLSSMEIF